MKQPTIKVYDDFVSAADGVATTVDSSLDHMRALADMQPLSLHAVFQEEAVQKGGKLQAYIIHSGDGIHFQQKNATAEIPFFNFGPGALASRAGSEFLNAPPSHDCVQIEMVLTGVGGVTSGRLRVYATGLSRISRQRHPMTSLAAGVHDAVRRHLPEHVAASVEAFRERVGMSPATLGELRRLWRDGGGASTDAGRAEHAHFFLSVKAREEFSRFTREAQTLSPHVKRALKVAIARAAVSELARPDWEFESDVS